MPNSPAFGDLSITLTQPASAATGAQGTYSVGRGSVSDGDGVGAIQYQWQLSSDALTWVDIPGATSASHSFRPEDAWKTFRVVGTFVDGAGHLETVTSTVASIYQSPRVVPVGTPGDDILPGDLRSLGPTSALVVDAGAGFDTVTYNSNAVYTAYDDNHDLLVGYGFTSLHGPLGINLLKNVEEVRFNDVTLVVDLGGTKDNAVYELYQATFGRMPDKGGFRYWVGQVDSGSVSLNDVASTFANSPEFQQKYGTPDNRAFVQELYANALHRQGDQTGVDFWTSVADRGVGRDQLLMIFATSQENVALLGSHMSGGYWTSET